MTTPEDLTRDIVDLDPDLAGILIALSFEPTHTLVNRIQSWITKTESADERE